MNTVIYTRLRSMALGVVIAAGIATTIATGGSSGGGLGPEPPVGPTLNITEANAEDVASALIITIGLGFDIGDLSGDEVVPQAANDPDDVLGLLFGGGWSGKPTYGVASKLENCTADGTADITRELADPGTLTVGDHINAVFIDCDDGEGYVLNGEVDITVADKQGDLAAGIFLLSLDTIATGVEVTKGTDTAFFDGTFTLTLDTRDFPVIAQRLAGSELEFAYGAETVTLTDFDHYIEVDFGVSPETVLVVVSGRLDSQLLGGSVDYETPVPVRAIGDDEPYTGEILITGADDSNVRIVIVDSTRVTLEVDTNGDGVVDAFIDTTFAALNGHTSTVNASTAPVIAREVIHGVNGFGSMAVIGGSQFQANGVFEQIRLQSVFGEFGPITVNCISGGTAMVSGFIANPGTYSPDDNLVTSFAACARSGEIVNGVMDLTIVDFTRGAADVYWFNGSVTLDFLERNAGGATYAGTGSYDLVYDFRLTSPGLVDAVALTPSLTISAGGSDRLLSGAGVDAEIVAGAPPVTITRSSAGALTSAALDGSFNYESIIPDSFLFDTDPNTGPFSGELLVTASDGSTLRIVAIDDTNVRLEIDYDGDSIVDTEINTTWAALQ
jgi:hypothetical protein